MSYIFQSKFADRLYDFIEQKKAVGFIYEESIRLLGKFDKFCYTNFSAESILTKEIFYTWAVRTDSESSNTFRNRLMPVREFARYLNHLGEAAFVLSPNFAKKGPRHIPHIYSEEEIKILWNYLDNIPPKKNFPIRHLVIPTFVRLLYCCGLRPCEARRLHVTDVDLERGRINVLESKGHKDRIVMMADDVNEMCKKYHEEASLLMPNRNLFFPNSQGNIYTKVWIDKTFRIAKARVGITKSGDCEPRLYDFRHTFATHKLYQWMKAGEDITALLPYLSAYMGHAQLSDTYYYIHLVPGLFEKMSGFDYSLSENLFPEVECDE